MALTNLPVTSEHTKGFILPMTLALISLVGLWGTILLEQMQIQSAHMEKSRHEKLIFYKAQAHLNQCLTQQNVATATATIIDQCCLFEELSTIKGKKSSSHSQQKLYRVSVHHQLVHPLNKTILGAARLQTSFIQSAHSPARIAISWREIFDLSWEKELSRETAGKPFIWDQLPICQHLLKTH
ncbi:hypothetical protein [Polynucleobacter kasalickyi]|uniref:Uncharacterized protein n=1 Tax=Polynucleobacter kasalickyi TaxID=1938817 RepID=A0A1W1Y1U3_9BURK|nr:hypothetical protein [Polynucleobacter kasalickyi]SMC30112.1 hypothetical protein SAMN06296008_10144 [Polynucleobacter kasalickyi]